MSTHDNTFESVLSNWTIMLADLLELFIVTMESNTFNGLASLMNPRAVFDVCANFCQRRANERLNWAFVLTNENKPFSVTLEINAFVWWIRFCFALKKRERYMEIHLEQGKPGGLWSYWRYRAIKQKRST